VITIGGLTILLSLFSVALAILQILSTIKQLNSDPPRDDLGDILTDQTSQSSMVTMIAIIWGVVGVLVLVAGCWPRFRPQGDIAYKQRKTVPDLTWQVKWKCVSKPI
jgi:hypothetical protein